MNNSLLKFCFYSALIFAYQFAVAGVEIKGQIISLKGDIPKQIFIASFNHQSHIDTIPVNIYGGFSYRSKETVPAYYQLVSGTTSFSFFALPQAEPIRIMLQTNGGQIVSSATEDYRENDAFEKLSKILVNYDVFIAQAIQNKEPDSIFKAIFSDYSKTLNSFKLAEKGTFAGDSLVNLRLFPILSIDNKKEVYPQFLFNFFYSVNFKNENLLATTIYSNMVDFFVKALCDNVSVKQQEELISNLMQRAKVSKILYNYTAEKIYVSAVSGEKEEMTTAFTQWLNTEEEASSLSVLRAKTKQLSASMPGKSFMDIPLKNSSIYQSLSQVVVKNKFTLLAFWESDCHHCRSVMPVVKMVYDTFNLKGFDVVAVSLDQDTVAWKNYLSQLQPKWSNINIPNPTSPIVNHYFIFQLPTLILIDKKGIIVKRLSSIATIGDFLDKVLK